MLRTISRGWQRSAKEIQFDYIHKKEKETLRIITLRLGYIIRTMIMLKVKVFGVQKSVYKFCETIATVGEWLCVKRS